VVTDESVMAMVVSAIGSDEMVESDTVGKLDSAGGLSSLLQLIKKMEAAMAAAARKIR
jgi:hypothetical protein